VVVGTGEGLLFANRLWDPCDAFQDVPFSGEEAYPSRSRCITAALKTVTTDDSGLPAIIIETYDYVSTSWHGLQVGSLT